MNGYKRNEDGTLEIVEIHNISNTLHSGTTPLARTDRVTELMGWPDNGMARTYETDGGVEILIPQSAHAVYVEDAICVGSGRQYYKHITGITAPIRSQISDLEHVHGPLTILVDSHTRWNGQQYKRAVKTPGGRYDHRQINDSDYVIVATI